MARQLTDARRTLILDAARRTFGARGYLATNVADIASDLGMGHGTFYRYFESKRDVFDVVVDEALGRILAVTRGRDPTAPRCLAEHAAEVDRIGRELYRAFSEDAVAARLVFFEGPTVDASVRARIDAAFQAFATFTAAYLHNGVSRGYLRPDFDVDATAAALTAVTFEGLRRLADNPDPAAESARWIRIYQALASGLAARTGVES